MLEVQTFLTTQTFGQLETEWGVNARLSTNGTKVSLNYDQFASRPGDPNTGVCRGLIVRKADGSKFCNVQADLSNVCPGSTVVIARAFDRFYNAHESCAAAIDWADPQLQILEKLDGTLCILYWDDIASEWCVATRSVADADLPLTNNVRTFRTLFEEALQVTLGLSFADWTAGLDKALTTCYELTSPYNRVIVKYDEPRLWLIGGRATQSGRELTDAEIRQSSPSKDHPFPPGPKSFTVGNSLAEIAAFVNTLPAEACEGAIAIDSKFNRNKSKSLAWVTSNKVMSYASAHPRNLLRAILEGVSDDVMSVVPDDVQEQIRNLQNEMIKCFERIDTLCQIYIAQAGGNRKLFAQQVIGSKLWTTPFFNRWDGKSTSAADYIRRLIANEKLSDSTLDTVLTQLQV